MRSLAIALILVLSTVAQAGEVFRYVTKDGVVSFTDTEKTIPARYKDVTEKIEVGPFKDFDRLTVVTTEKPEAVVASAAHLARLRASRAPVVQTNECTGPITVTSERRQFGEYNREVYLVHDECGNLVSETFYQPEVRIGR